MSTRPPMMMPMMAPTASAPHSTPSTGSSQRLLLTCVVLTRPALVVNTCSQSARGVGEQADEAPPHCCCRAKRDCREGGWGTSPQQNCMDAWPMLVQRGCRA